MQGTSELPRNELEQALAGIWAGALGLDAAITPKSGNIVSTRLRIAGVLGRERLGDFALSPGQAPPLNLFLPYEALRKQLGLGTSANLMLTGEIGSIVRRHRFQPSDGGQRRRSIVRHIARTIPLAGSCSPPCSP